MGTHCHLMVAQCCLPSLERIPRSAGPITTVAMQRRWPKFVARCHRRCSLPSRCDQIYRAVDWPPGWQCHGSGTRGTLPVASALICGVPCGLTKCADPIHQNLKAAMLRFRLSPVAHQYPLAPPTSMKRKRVFLGHISGTRAPWPRMPSIEPLGVLCGGLRRHSVKSYRRQGVAPHPAGLPCRQSADKAPRH